MSFAPPEHSSRVFETEGLIIGGPGCVVGGVVGFLAVKAFKGKKKKKDQDQETD